MNLAFETDLGVDFCCNFMGSLNVSESEELAVAT